MKNNWAYLSLTLLAAILLLDVFQLIKMSPSIDHAAETEFLPMVYENQITQGISTDGREIYNSGFHHEILRREASQPVLVLRYSGLSCRSCVQSCINALRRQCPDFENNNRVLIVVSDVTPSQIISGSLILDSGETLGYDLEGTRIPHFFVFDPITQQIKHTYLPDQTDLNALRIYLTSVTGRYGI